MRDHYNELAVSVEETGRPGRRFTLRVRAFDDGIGFRYEFPEQPGLGAFEITEELTEFALADNARAWWIPSNWPRMDRSEMLYSSGPVSVLDSVQTPLTMEIQDGRTFMVIHEANLVDYARMFLPDAAEREPHPAGGAGADGGRDQGAGPHAVRDARGAPSSWPTRPPSSRPRCSASSSTRPTRSPAPTGSSR